MGMKEMENIVNILVGGVMNRVNLLMEQNEKLTVTSREIQSAVRMLLPNDLSRHSVSEGTKAVTLYNASLPEYGEARGGKQSRSSRAGLTFPVKRVENAIRALSTGSRVGVGSGVYLAAVLEYIVAEILEHAGTYARGDKKVRITPKHIRTALTAPKTKGFAAGEFSTLFQGVFIAGVVIRPKIVSTSD